VGGAALCRRAVAAMIALVTAGSVLGVAGPAAAAASYPLDPAYDVSFPDAAMGPACTYHPMRDKCENIMIRALDRGRAALGAPAYTLPSRFHSLGGRDQLLVLANRDRRLYRRATVAGLNPTLNASAQRGALASEDPAWVSVGGHMLLSGGSNWAGGTPSPLLAYFLWMYDDSGSGWQHRHNVLMRVGDRDNVLLMGAGASGSGDWTSLFETFAPGTLFQCVPTVLGLSVRSGTDSGKGTLRIFGFGFQHVRQVTFDGVAATFVRNSLFTITAAPPPHAPGPVHVQVRTTGGTSRASAAALYVY
jgi:hypothetical protein